MEYIHRRRTELCAEYMSDVLPDRKALYQQAKNALKGQGGEACRKEVCAGRRRNADLSDPDKLGIWCGYLLR